MRAWACLIALAALLPSTQGWTYTKISTTGPCATTISGNKRFHQRCHCHGVAVGDSRCITACDNNANCQAYVYGSHGCQWSVSVNNPSQCSAISGYSCGQYDTGNTGPIESWNAFSYYYGCYKRNAGPPPTPPPTKYPTKFPTPYPTPAPTRYPTKFPTPYPTPAPTKYPTKFPTPYPTPAPTRYPTKFPTPYPTPVPSKFPTTFPSPYPTKYPTPSPSRYPTKYPTPVPSRFPTTFPSPYPTNYPTPVPTKFPTPVPTNAPTKFPTKYPTPFPTPYPTRNPVTQHPISGHPSCHPTSGHPTSGHPTSSNPTEYPTFHPSSFSPTVDPTMSPATASPGTANPTINPTMGPTMNPTTASPQSARPTMNPTIDPTMAPTLNPTVNPTMNPTIDPTMAPTLNPTVSPTLNPTIDPTMAPTLSPATASPATAGPTTSPATATPTSSPTRLAPGILISIPTPVYPAQQTIIDAVITHPAGYNPPASSTYAWKIYRVDAGGNRVDVTSAMSGAATTRLMVPKGALAPNQAYAIDFTADNQPLYSAAFTQSATFTTSASNVVADIKVDGASGVSFKDAQVSNALSLDGSASYDPDMATGATQSYAWSCVRISTTVSVPQPCNLPSSLALTGTSLTLPANTMETGWTYSFELDYTVTVTATGFSRMSSAYVLIRPSNDPIPDIRLTAEWAGKSEGATKLPFGLGATIRSNAVSRANSANVLSYSWSAMNADSNTALTLTGTAEADLAIPASQFVAGANYRITVKVTDLGVGTEATAYIDLATSSPPVISSVTVSPGSGTEYKTSFTATCTGTATEVPMSYMFSYTDVASGSTSYLTGYTADSSVAFTVPRGNYTVSCSVQDNLGVSATQTTAGQIVVAAEVISAGPGSNPCAQWNNTLYAMTASLPDTGNGNGVCGDIDRGFSSLISSFSYGRMFVLLQQFATEISRVQSGIDESCNAQLTYGCDAATDAQSALAAMYNTVQIASSTIINSGGANRATSQALQTLLAQSYSIPDTSTMSTLIDSATTVFTTSSDLADGTNGQTAATIVSNLLSAGVRLSNATNTSSALYGRERAMSRGCQLLENAVDVLVGELLKKSTLGLVVNAPKVTYSTEYFKAEFMAVYSASTQATDIGFIGTMPALPSGMNTAVLSVIKYANDIRENGIWACRNIGSIRAETAIYDVTLAAPGNSTSVAFYPSNITMTLPAISAGRGAAQCDADQQCVWWNRDQLAWNSTGCTYVPSMYGQAAYCRCTHLTEFVISTQLVDCPSDSVSALDVTFGVLGLLYVAFLIAALSRIYKLRQRKDSNSQVREFKLLMLLAIVRLGSCAAFFLAESNILLHAIAMCIGGAISFANFAHLNYMWGAAYQLANFSQKSEKPLLTVLTASSALVTGIVVVLCALYAKSSAKTFDQSAAIICILASLLVVAYTYRFISKLDMGKPGSATQKAIMVNQVRAAERTRNVVAVCFALFVTQNAGWAYSGVVGIAMCLVVEFVSISVHLVGHWLGMGAKQKGHMKTESGRYDDMKSLNYSVAASGSGFELKTTHVKAVSSSGGAFPRMDSLQQLAFADEGVETNNNPLHPSFPGHRRGGASDSFGGSMASINHIRQGSAMNLLESNDGSSQNINGIAVEGSSSSSGSSSDSESSSASETSDSQEEEKFSSMLPPPEMTTSGGTAERKGAAPALVEVQSSAAVSPVARRGSITSTIAGTAMQDSSDSESGSGSSGSSSGSSSTDSEEDNMPVIV